MKLVMTYSDSDGYTYSCDVTLPVEYESAEALYVDFTDGITKAFMERSSSFEFLGEEFMPSAFFSFLEKNVYKRYCELNMQSQMIKDSSGAHYLYSPVSVYTLDEWFANNCLSG